MNRFSFLLLAAYSVAISCCVKPKAYSPATGRIRTVTLPASSAQNERGHYLANHVAVCLEMYAGMSEQDLGAIYENLKTGKEKRRSFYS